MNGRASIVASVNIPEWALAPLAGPPTTARRLLARVATRFATNQLNRLHAHLFWEVSQRKWSFRLKRYLCMERRTKQDILLGLDLRSASVLWATEPSSSSQIGASGPAGTYTSASSIHSSKARVAWPAGCADVPSPTLAPRTSAKHLCKKRSRALRIAECCP